MHLKIAMIPAKMTALMNVVDDEDLGAAVPWILNIIHEEHLKYLYAP